MDLNNTTESIDISFKNEIYELIILYVIVFISAFISNVIIIIIVIKDQYMRNVTNYLLVNLAIADLLVTLICMPTAMLRAYTLENYFPEYMCKVTAYFQSISVASSIFTITTMAVDRYLAIAKPFGMHHRCFTKKSTIVIIISLWLISSLLFSPLLVVISLKPDAVFPKLSYSIEEWPDHWPMQQVVGTVWFVVMFAVPGVIMLFAYSMMGRTLCSAMPPFDGDEGFSSCQQRNRLIRDRKRVACILLLLAFVFAICWMPHHLYNLLKDYDVIVPAMHDFSIHLPKYLLFLGHSNSALNPIIYCALSRKFRKSIKNLFHFQWKCRRKPQLNNWQDSSGGTQLNYLCRLKLIPNTPNQINLSLSRRLQSSQKVTTKTYVV